MYFAMYCVAILGSVLPLQVSQQIQALFSPCLRRSDRTLLWGSVLLRLVVCRNRRKPSLVYGPGISFHGEMTCICRVVPVEGED